MIVVAIIGILAAVAIPAFSRYVKKSRTTEAFGHLNKMYAGSVTYYETDRVNWDGEPQPAVSAFGRRRSDGRVRLSGGRSLREAPKFEY